MIQKYKLGDILDFTILDIENKRKRMILDILDINEKQNAIKENIGDEKKSNVHTNNLDSNDNVENIAMALSPNILLLLANHNIKNEDSITTGIAK